MIFQSQVTRASTVRTPSQQQADLQLQSKCACGRNAVSSNGECEECNKNHKQSWALRVQPRLAVSKPGDRFEQEADDVADAALSGSVASLPKSTASAGSYGTELNLASPLIGEVLQSEGQPLDTGIRARMTERFGYDFGHVRVHTDTRANKSAQAVNAHAYTVGGHIVFGAGSYAPATVAGQKLLAHELTHVVQQGRGDDSQLIQRAAVQYVEQVADTEPTAAQILSKFDQSVAAIEKNVKTQTGPQMSDLTAAATQLKSLRTAGKVAVWRMITMPPVYASFDNGSGQIRLNYSYPDISISENTLVHEAIHAVHAAANPEIAAAYAKGLKSGVPEKETATIAVVHKWKAWTEYWAYRRATEYSAGARLATDPDMGHRVAMANQDVKVSVMTAKGDDPTFDPKTWQPTAADKAIALKFTGKSGATAKP